MASLQAIESKRPRTGKGRSPTRLWRLQFLHASKRHSLRLGKLSVENANTAKWHIEHLIYCFETNQQPQPETQDWLRRNERLMLKLARLGLCKPYASPTIHEWISVYLETRTIKDGTRTNLETAYAALKRYWGPHIKMISVTPQDATDYWHWLRGQVKSENTAKRRLGRVRELFAYAVEQQVISHNPFKLRSLPVAVGAAVKQYVPAKTVQKIIDRIPKDRTDLRLILACGRFMGVRMPSELLGLQWLHVNFAENKILITSPKTERHGKRARWVPIFAGLEKLLLDHAEKRGESELVFPAMSKNPATTMVKYTELAGVDVWSNYWNSLRASCETDLMDAYGVRRACQWIGNTPAVAMKNYSLVRSEDFVHGKRRKDSWLKLPEKVMKDEPRDAKASQI